MLHPCIHFHPPTFNGSLVTTVESKTAENIRMVPKFLFYVIQKYYIHKSAIFLHNIYYSKEHQNHKIQGCQFSAGNVVFCLRSSRLRHVFNNEPRELKE